MIFNLEKIKYILLFNYERTHLCPEGVSLGGDDHTSSYDVEALGVQGHVLKSCGGWAEQ
jgi:hypothetical protein